MRMDWTALPEAVTKEVANRIDGSRVLPATAGDHAEIAATVAGARGKVFVKAARTELGVRSLRYELRVSEAVSGSHSPAVEWHFEAAGWLVVAFEHCEGPHADLSPGSTDLGLLAATLQDLGGTPAPDARLFVPSERFGFAHPAMDGDRLVHTDLTAANLIVTTQGLRIVDWAMATEAAPWVELAALVAWLIGAGHTPEQAEQWLAQHSAWHEVDPAVLTFFALRNAEKWALKSRQGSAGWMHDLADWTGQWAAYRRRPAN
ncbi:phosphotransferase [Actinoplanes sp. NEAU-A12]|uniref:Phosphotransferase n=1 Tax=Actinoplanes sandaracinus TaxID=3045177 RepID=A0ABT6WI32_9ACTN|nr:phosphotransferase [Actinoplanes sandaracinus]MDI6099335.1 phosphotransferase [Actinoplanes sandaracinus]